MHAAAIRLTDFRNYTHVDLELSAGTSVIVGENGQGKTNLVEALCYASTHGSHRVSGDAPLVRESCEKAYVSVDVDRAGRSTRLDVLIARKGRNTYKVAGNNVRRPQDAVGVVKTVLFAPEDVHIVRGEPTLRRSFIDTVLAQISPRFVGVKADYDKVVKQRNALLKAGDPATDEPLLASWDEQLVGLGSDVMYARSYALGELVPFVQDAYALLAGDDARVGASWKSRLDDYLEVAALSRQECEDFLRLQLPAKRSEEWARGVSVVGPHRDDISLTLNGLEARLCASQGECWSLALSLRVGSYSMLRDKGPGELGEREPILVLDDVFAVLDASRRQALVSVVEQAEQALVTAAVFDDVPPSLRHQEVRIKAGQVVS